MNMSNNNNGMNNPLFRQLIIRNLRQEYEMLGVLQDRAKLLGDKDGVEVCRQKRQTLREKLFALDKPAAVTMTLLPTRFTPEDLPEDGFVLRVEMSIVKYTMWFLHRTDAVAEAANLMDHEMRQFAKKNGRLNVKMEISAVFRYGAPEVDSNGKQPASTSGHGPRRGAGTVPRGPLPVPTAPSAIVVGDMPSDDDLNSFVPELDDLQERF
jgi:hypothetical protein